LNNPSRKGGELCGAPTDDIIDTKSACNSFWINTLHLLSSDHNSFIHPRAKRMPARSKKGDDLNQARRAQMFLCGGGMLHGMIALARSDCGLDFGDVFSSKMKKEETK
jgi:hypothetical protein